MRVGIFDSGMGGLKALDYFKSLAPLEDAILYRDEANAPYGTKTESQLIRLVSDDIDRLTLLGAKKILMACCTASAVWDKLSPQRRKIAIPIIEPTSRAAIKVAGGKPIGVISTEATERMEAFPRAIRSLSYTAEVIPLSSRILVSLAEAGVSDENMSAAAEEETLRIRRHFEGKGIGALILGCTHFSYFRREIEGALGVKAVDSAEVGAMELANALRA